MPFSTASKWPPAPTASSSIACKSYQDCVETSWQTYMPSLGQKVWLHHVRLLVAAHLERCLILRRFFCNRRVRFFFHFQRNLDRAFL
mmetsp:Transcript_2534/g.4357  ORF Transcript_2534/g.4357 Transcript_2534/m.4357 type:complete len:87 (-) Transcript_2534:76-336(-)